MSAILLSIQVGLPAVRDEADAEQRWVTGMFKETVTGAVRITPHGIPGDGQADLRNHGGPDKAVNVYPVEHFRHWESALGIGPLVAGAFGENFTLQGALEDAVCIGDILRIGSALVQVSQPRAPCWKLSRRWQVPDLAQRVEQSGKTGWYLRVLEEGLAVAGLRLELVARPNPGWTVAAANEIMHQRKDDLDAARALAGCAALAESWRQKFLRRAAGTSSESSAARLDGPQGRVHKDRPS